MANDHWLREKDLQEYASFARADEVLKNKTMTTQEIVKLLNEAYDAMPKESKRMDSEDVATKKLARAIVELENQIYDATN